MAEPKVMQALVEDLCRIARERLGTKIDVAVFTIEKEPDPDHPETHFIPVVGFAGTCQEEELRQVMAGWGMEGGSPAVN